MSYFRSKFSDDLLAVWASGVVLFLFCFVRCRCCCCSFSHILIDSTSFIFSSGTIMFNTTLQAIACENSRLSSLPAARNKGRRPGGVLPYMGYIGMCRCEGYGFQAVYSRIGYINQSVWLKNRVSFFRKMISWLKILSRLGTQLL